jgi:hypothetical protein
MRARHLASIAREGAWHFLVRAGSSAIALPLAADEGVPGADPW